MIRGPQRLALYERRRGMLAAAEVCSLINYIMSAAEACLGPCFLYERRRGMFATRAPQRHVIAGEGVKNGVGAGRLTDA